jgi:hypothetical protein
LERKKGAGSWELGTVLDFADSAGSYLQMSQTKIPHRASHMQTMTGSANTSVLSDLPWSNAKQRSVFPLSKVWTSRVLFLSCLLGVAGILGYTVHHVLTDSEAKLAEEHFESIADRALDAAHAILLRKREGAITLASIASYQFPDAATWPLVNINGFEAIAANVIRTSNGRSMGLCPLVTSDKLSEFEEFAYSQVIEPKFPNGTGVSSFGKGVFTLDPSVNTTDNRYHATDAAFTAPFLFNSLGGALLMGNVHSGPIFGPIIDDIIACANERHASEGVFSLECSVLSDMLIPYGETAAVKTGPAAVIMHPIYPANDNTAVSNMNKLPISGTSLVSAHLMMLPFVFCSWLGSLPRQFSGVKC